LDPNQIINENNLDFHLIHFNYDEIR
jgi:hypothetical protein